MKILIKAILFWLVAKPVLQKKLNVRGQNMQQMKARLFVPVGNFGLFDENATGYIPYQYCHRQADVAELIKLKVSPITFLEII